MHYLLWCPEQKQFKIRDLMETWGPASEVNDWRLRLSSVEISIYFQSTYFMVNCSGELTKFKWWRESVLESAAQLLQGKVNCGSVQTDKTTSQFLDTAGAVPLCRAERGSVLGDTDKVSRHLPFPFDFLSTSLVKVSSRCSRCRRGARCRCRLTGCLGWSVQGTSIFPSSHLWTLVSTKVLVSDNGLTLAKVLMALKMLTMGGWGGGAKDFKDWQKTKDFLNVWQKIKLNIWPWKIWQRFSNVFYKRFPKTDFFECQLCAIEDFDKRQKIFNK